MFTFIVTRAMRRSVQQFLQHNQSYSKHGPTDLKGRKTAAQKWLIRQHKDPYVKLAHQEYYRCRSAFKLLEMDDKYSLLQPGSTVIDLGAAPGAWSQVAVDRVNALGISEMLQKDQEPQLRKKLQEQENNYPVNQAEIIGQPQGRVISVDLQHMSPLDGATVLTPCDFTLDSVQQHLLYLLNTEQQCSMANKSNPAIIFSKIKLPATNYSVATSPETRPTIQCRANILLSDMAPSPSGIKSLDHQKIIALATAVLRFSLASLEDGGSCIVKLWRGADTERLTSAMAKCFSDVREVKPLASRSDSSEIFVVARKFHL